jgi:glycerol dehydrogenase-like iron-containing ADH family enzyme
MDNNIGLGYISTIDDVLTRQIFFERCIKNKSWTAVAIAVGGGNTADGCRMIYKRYKKEHPPR